jgi:UDP-glucuronate 4-epimerase
VAVKKKVLVTGASGPIFRTVATELAQRDEVWAIGRFGDSGVRESLEAAGVRTAFWDMGASRLDGIPDDFTHVLHAATLRGTDDPWRVMTVNSVGTGMLMTHCRKAAAFVAVSSFGVYRFISPEHRYAEADAVSGFTPGLPSYATTKLVEEGVVHSYGETLGIPSVIARLNASFGPAGRGGMLVILARRLIAGDSILLRQDGEEEWFSPIYTSDLSRQVEALWSVASNPPTVLNWAGDEAVSVRGAVEVLSSITGRKPLYRPDGDGWGLMASDNSRRESLIGKCRKPWREDLAEALAAHFPELGDVQKDAV